MTCVSCLVRFAHVLATSGVRAYRICIRCLLTATVAASSTSVVNTSACFCLFSNTLIAHHLQAMSMLHLSLTSSAQFLFLIWCRLACLRKASFHMFGTTVVLQKQAHSAEEFAGKRVEMPAAAAQNLQSPLWAVRLLIPCALNKQKDKALFIARNHKGGQMCRDCY